MGVSLSLSAVIWGLFQGLPDNVPSVRLTRQQFFDVTNHQRIYILSNKVSQFACKSLYTANLQHSAGKEEKYFLRCFVF